MFDYYNGYDDFEAPEPTEAELHADYIEMLAEGAPAADWDTCYCDDDNMCPTCVVQLIAKRNPGRAIAGMERAA